MIFVIDDDEIMRECIVRACGDDVEVREFGDGLAAMELITDGIIPDLVFLDILLDGPNGFTLLNEMVSYVDTAKVPVVIVTSLDMADKDLSVYGVVGILAKDVMRPSEVRSYVEEYAK